MKRLVLCMMVLASLTAFAQVDETGYIGEKSHKNEVCAPCEAAKLAKLKQNRVEGKETGSSRSTATIDQGSKGVRKK